jgi:hypothetical protein
MCQFSNNGSIVTFSKGAPCASDVMLTINATLQVCSSSHYSIARLFAYLLHAQIGFMLIFASRVSAILRVASKNPFGTDHYVFNRQEGAANFIGCFGSVLCKTRWITQWNSGIITYNYTIANLLCFSEMRGWSRHKTSCWRTGSPEYGEIPLFTSLEPDKSDTATRTEFHSSQKITRSSSCDQRGLGVLMSLSPSHGPAASNAQGDKPRRKRIRLSLACNQVRSSSDVD